MRLTKLLLAGAIVASVITFGAGPCPAQDVEERDMKMMSANLTAVDTFNSTITVKWQDTDLIHYNYLTFAIPEGMTFDRGSDKVDIMDINVEDPVTIEYYFDPSGTPKIVRMQVGQD